MSESQPNKFYLSSHTKKATFQHYPISQEVLQLLRDEDKRRPTLVQAETLPITLQENLTDLCIIIYAYNGAGKTLTYLIPLLNSLENIPCFGKVMFKNEQRTVCRPQAIIVVPTEVLVTQVYEYLINFAQYYEKHYQWNIQIGKVYGNENTKGHIIVGMPFKIHNMLKDSEAGAVSLMELKWLVFDECDEIKQSQPEKFQKTLQLFQISKSLNYHSNLLITSATGVKSSFRRFVQSHLVSHNIVEIDCKEEDKGLQGVTHFYAPEENKDQVVFQLLEKLANLEDKTQVIIFFNQISEIREFYDRLKEEKKRFVVNDEAASGKGKSNLMVDYVHGKCGYRSEIAEDTIRTKSERTNRLRNKEIQVLLGTDMIGRGIDIRTVSLVINYFQPMHNKTINTVTYIHRVGRTGRYSDEGVALTFVRNNIFVRLAEEEQKIKFSPMPPANQLMGLVMECAGKNKSEHNQKQ